MMQLLILILKKYKIYTKNTKFLEKLKESGFFAPGGLYPLPPSGR
jgi:hypothetical protein